MREKIFQTVRSPLILALVTFGLALIPRWSGLDVFVGPDEFSWVQRSANFTKALAEGNLAETYQTGHPGVSLMWVETIGSWLRFGLDGFDNWSTALGVDKTMAILGVKRQTVAVMNALIVTGCALLVSKIFDYKIAWLAGFLLAFDPFFITESRALRTEGLVTGFNALTLLSLLLYLPKPCLRYSILAGIFTGLALLSKVSAIVLLPVSFLTFGATPFLKTGADKPKGEPFRVAGKLFLAWGAALLLTILALWPAMWVGPIEVAQKMYDYVAFRAVEGEGGGSGTFFWGQPTNYEDLGLLFYPAALLYRTGPWVWLGLILLAVMIWLKPRGDDSERQNTSSTSPLFLSLGVMGLYLALYFILITQAQLKFDRYIIPMLPILDIMAAVGLVIGWRRFTQSTPWVGRLGWAAALLILISQIILTLPHHPYYYTFWNPLLGGLKQAAHVLPVGEGEGLDQVAAYLNNRPDVATLNLALANSQKIDPVFNGQTIPLDNLDGKWTQADYVLIYISQLQRGKHAEDILTYLSRHSPEYTLTLHSLEYAWLYPGPAAQYYGGGHKLEGRGTLFGYSFPSSPPRKDDQKEGAEVLAGESLPVTLYWRNEGQREDDRLFARLMDMDGYVWAEAIAQPRPGFEEANRRENSIVESEAVLTLPIGIPPGVYFFKPGFRAAAGEVIGYFELPDAPPSIQVDAARQYPPPGRFHPPHPVSFTVNTDVALVGYNLQPEQVAPGANTWVTLYWQALTGVDHDYVILLRLLDIRGQELAYWLGRPVRSGYPTTQWRAGQLVQDPWLLPIPSQATPGDYQLELAVFDAATETEINRRVLGPVRIGPAEGD